MHQKELLWDAYLSPIITTNDQNAFTGAYFAGSDIPAITIKEMDGWTSVLYGSKVITADFIKEIARSAGCHIYSEGDDVLFANKNFVTIHASSSGKKVLRFKETCSPFELYEEKYYGTNVKEIEFDMNFGETKMFYLTNK